MLLNESQLVSFPLYHGTSSHYVQNFKPGKAPVGWPHKDAALALLRKAWSILRQSGHQPEWWVERILVQNSGHANWQHGELYLTPSQQSAVRYAGGGAAYGGELLTLCREALDELAQVNKNRAESLIQDFGALAHLLAGGGHPILVELGNIRIGELSTELESDNVHNSFSFLANRRSPEIFGQQMNFRLDAGCGLVRRVFEVDIEHVHDPISKFALHEIDELSQ